MSVRTFRRTLPAAVAALLAAGPTVTADPPAVNPSDVESAVFARTNEVRRQHHLRELTRDPRLDRAAHDLAGHMARTGKFSHEADDRKPWDRTIAAGYDPAFVSENIAWEQAPGSPTAEELAGRLVQGWLDSPGHRRNLLDPDVYDLGVGAARAEDGKWYGVQVFGVPGSKAFEFRVGNETGQAVTYRLGDQSFTVKPDETQIHKLPKPTTFTLNQPESAGGAEPIRREVKGAGGVVLRKEGDRFVAG
jgi:uncharacterized protein YkwD